MTTVLLIDEDLLKMNSFNDLSQMSDLQSISRISRVSCSRICGRIDSLQNLFEQCSINNNVSKNTVNQGSNHLEKIVKCLTVCEESIGDYIKSEIILKCIQDASRNVKGTLSDDVVAKLKGLLLIHELNKYMRLSPMLVSIQEESSVLGITDLPKYDLSYEQMLSIKCYVETLLREKIQAFILRYEQLGGNVKEVLRSTDCNMRKKIFESHAVQILMWKDKIEELCGQYEADIIKCKNLIDKWNKLKYEDVSRIYLEKAQYILLQAQVAEVQAKITKISCIMKMYKETPVTIDAYRILNTTVEEKLFAIMNEIKEKENLKKQYESLQNAEYDEVLKTYLNFCKAIKTKKQILKKL